MGHNRAPAPQHNAPLFDHLVGGRQDRGRHREAERLGGLQVDNQFKLDWLLHGQIAWPRAFEDFVDEGRRSVAEVGTVHPNE